MGGGGLAEWKGGGLAPGWGTVKGEAAVRDREEVETRGVEWGRGVLWVVLAGDHVGCFLI